MTRPFATRAWSYTIIASVLSVAIAFGLFWSVRSAYVVAQRTSELSRKTVALASGVAAEEAFGTSTDATRLKQTLFRVQSGLMGAALLVTDTQGRVVRSSGEIDIQSVPLAGLGAPNESGARTGVRRAAGSLRALIVAAPIADSGRWLVAVQPVSTLLVPWDQLAGTVLVSIVAAVVIAGLVGWLLTRRLARPLRRLQAGAESVAAGDWGAQVPEEGDTELVSLARSFNRMSSKVAEAYAAQRAFVGDVSHELRTPITSVRGYSEAILDGTMNRPEDVRRAASVIHSEALRMEETSQTLLALASLDVEGAEASVAPIDVSSLRGALAERFDARARRAQITLSWLLEDEPQPLGDFDRLLQATTAILSNALTYTPSSGSVRVRTVSETGVWMLQIDDSGPGIPPERRESVFERFVRLDPSRAKGSGGVGLGLSIARRAVELMGGRIHASESDDLGGARFEITLPLAAESA